MKHKVKLKGVLRLLLRWPAVFSVLFAIMDIQLFLYNIKAGIIGLFYFAVYILASALVV